MTLDPKHITNSYLDFCHPLTESSNDLNWIFQVPVRKHQYIKFKEDSLSCNVIGYMENSTYNANAGAEDTNRFQYHTLQAKSNTPGVYTEEYVEGRQFIKNVDLFLDNKAIPTDNLSYGGATYCKLNAVFNRPKDPKCKNLILTSKDVAPFKVGGPAGDTKYPDPVKAGMDPFDYGGVNGTKPKKLTFYLNGYCFFNDNNISDRNNYKNCLPPGTKIEIRVQLHENFEQLLYRTNLPFDTYFSDTAVTADEKAAKGLNLKFSDITLSYEVFEISDFARLDYEQRMLRKGVLTYTWDVPQCQFAKLNDSDTMSDRTFAIQPQCKYAFIAFQPSHAIFHGSEPDKYASTWSKFPKGCTKIILEYNGENNLICKQELENFGIEDQDNEISKYLFYDYIKKNFTFKGKFSSIFDTEPNAQSLIQVIPLRLEHFRSKEPSSLHVQLFFGSNRCPKKYDIVCISVHATGRVELSNKGWKASLF